MSFFAKSYFFFLIVKHELLLSDFNSSIFVLSAIISNKSQLSFFRLETFLLDVLRSFLNICCFSREILTTLCISTWPLTHVKSFQNTKSFFFQNVIFFKIKRPIYKFFSQKNDWPAPFCFPDINNYLNSVFVFHVSTKVKNIYPWVGFLLTSYFGRISFKSYCCPEL